MFQEIAQCGSGLGAPFARQLIDHASFSEASTARSCSTGATLSSARRLTKGGFLSSFCRASANGRKVVHGVERQLGDAACMPRG